MSIVKILITPDHLKLLKYLKWTVNDKLFIESKEDDEVISPFGGIDLYDDINLILNGKPEDFDPFNTDEFEVYPEEQKTKWLKLYKELPYCLEIILNTQSFEFGTYAAKFHDRVWKKKD